MPLIIFLVTVLIVGCSTSPFSGGLPESLARQVTQSDHCGLEEAGIIYIESANRLSRFSGLPSQNLAIEELRETDFGREHLLIVSLGQKFTGGFGLTLANSRLVDDTLRLSMILRRPPADAMVSQVLTTPCVVVAITADHWESLEVRGNGLDPLRFNR